MSETATSQQHHAICPECVRIVSKDDSEDAGDVVESHNESRHNGAPVARVVGPYREHLNEFMDDMKEKYGVRSSTYEDIATHIVETDPWGVR